MFLSKLEKNVQLILSIFAELKEALETYYTLKNYHLAINIAILTYT